MIFATNRRRLLTGGVSGLGAAGLAGCANGAIAGLDKRARSLDIANQDEPLTLDPQKCAGTWENNIVGNMFVGLTMEDAKAEPIPGMAERWEVSEDALTWTFYLRPAVWSDGVRCDAHDFVYAFRRVLDPASMAEYAPLLYPLKNAQQVNKGEAPPSALGVTALGDRVLEIQLDHPTPYLPQVLKHHAAYPVPKHTLERYGDAWIKPEHVVVNGPFTLVKWWSNYIVHLRKNPLYWEAGEVVFNDLYFYPTTNNNTAARGVESGERGWSTDFPTDLYDDLRGSIPAYVHCAPYLLMECFFFNCTRAPFNDVRVRQALSMALDREFIASRIFHTGEQPAYAIVPPGIANYTPTARYAWAGTPLEARRAEALRLLQAAGYGPDRPLRFALEHSTSRERPRVAVVAQADWRAIAPWVTVELKPTESQVHYANMRARNYDVGDGAWAADFNDARNYLYLFETRTGGQNYGGYSNLQFDDLVAQSDQASDLVQRAALMAQAEQIALNDCPLCASIFSVSKNLVHPDLTGFSDNLEDIHRARWFGIRNFLPKP